MNDSEVWEQIFYKLTEVIQKLENFQGAGKSYRPTPEDISEAIEILQETRFLIPVQGQVKRRKKPD